MKEIILSHFQANALLTAKKGGSLSVQISLDLGISAVEVQLKEAGLSLDDDQILCWEVVESIVDSKASCYVIEQGAAHAIQFYSEETERLYSLYPTVGAPSMLISGIPMHRIKDTEPYQDTLEKIRTIKPVVGQVLDTATGLGYTAIQAARTAEHGQRLKLNLQCYKYAGTIPGRRICSITRRSPR
jgi:predicted methyltransferase